MFKCLMFLSNSRCFLVVLSHKLVPSAKPVTKEPIILHHKETLFPHVERHDPMDEPLLPASRDVTTQDVLFRRRQMQGSIDIP